MDQNEIIQYLEGKATDEQALRVERWLKNPSNEKYIRKKLGDIWMNSNMEIKGEKPDFEGMLHQVHHLINLNAQNDTQENKTTITLSSLYRGFSKIAAILIVPLLLTFGYYLIKDNITSKEQTAATQRVISTKPGTRLQLQLPDGTLVWLNDATTLRYPDKFDKKERKVYIDGEAYFEVKSNTKQPFIVENPMLKTTVTGTKFNINAYVEDKYFEATLLEGIIAVERNNQHYELKPGYQVQWNRATDKYVSQHINTKIATAWIDGKLMLQNEPLAIAAKKLSRWYNVEIIIQSPELYDYMITATIEDEKPEQTFKLISFALPLKYAIKTKRVGTEIKRTVYLTKK